MGLSLNLRKEEFSLAYMQALTSFAGMMLLNPRIDQDSVDCDIRYPGQIHGFHMPEIHVQIKATATDIVHENLVKYPLNVKNYNDLRVSNVHVPRILVVLVLPPDGERWIKHHYEYLVLRKCAYWQSLRGCPATGNSKKVTINIPRYKRLSASALRRMMERIALYGTP